MTDKPFDLDSVYQGDVNQIYVAQQNAKIIHASRDIRASGDHVEQSARKIVTSRLPFRCRVTHGHVVDFHGRVSPQLDVIVCDGHGSHGLFQAADGTEFVPYESVYAIGEVKSTYYKAKDPIREFSNSISGIQSSHWRNVTNRNPLFSFMFFVDASTFQLNDVKELYCNTPVDALPTVICFLNRGILCHSRFGRNGYGALLPLAYHICPAEDTKPNTENHWTLLSWDANPAARNLMFLQVILSQHIETCRLEPPDLQHYLLQYIGTPVAWPIIVDDLEGTAG